MNVYQQMENIVRSTEGLKAAPGCKYLEAYKVDFDEYDKDMIENHFGGGNKLVWIIKGNGCGTELFNARSEHAKVMMDPTNEKVGDLYFTIDLTGNNEGTVKMVTLNQARDFVDHYQGTESPSPLRKSIHEQIDLAFGSTAKEAGTSKFNVHFRSDLMPTPGEQIYLKVEPEKHTRGQYGLATMVKPSLKPDPKGISRTKKNFSQRTVVLGPMIMGSDNLNPRYFRLTPHKNDGYADLESISKRSFDYAVSKLRKENPALSL